MKRVLASWATIVRKSPSSYERTVLQAARAQDASSVFELVKERIGREMSEVMYVICLDGQNHVLAMTEVARGGVHQVGVECVSLFRVAVAFAASGIILVHNHPSGDPTPSPADLAMTRRAEDAGKVIGIRLVDHVIVAGQRYVSLLDLGRIDAAA
jgi:DNA repair protein RadC